MLTCSSSCRCWNYSTQCGQDAAHPELCERCLPVIQRIDFTVPTAVKQPAGVA